MDFQVPALLAVVMASAPGASASPPWCGAERAPADVTLYLHVHRAAQLRESLASEPLGVAVRCLLADDSLTRRWSAVAQRLGLDESRLFDELLGRDLRFVARRGNAGPDWVLATELDEATLSRVRERLGGRMGAGGAIDFPCQGLVAVWRPPTLFVAPSRASELLAAALAPEPLAGGRALIDQPMVAAAAGWPPTQIQLFLRHDSTAIPASALGATVEGRTAIVRHRMSLRGWPPLEGRDGTGGGQLAARSDSDRNQSAPPLRGCGEPAAVPSTPGRTDGPAQATVDPSMLARFEEMAMAAAVRPVCDDSLLPLLRRILPDLEPCDGMRRNAGQRWLVVIGEAEATPSLPWRTPMMAVAVEVREPCRARRQHEAMLERAIAGFNARYSDSLGGPVILPKAPECADLESPQHCDLNRALRSVSHDHPLLRGCSLHWRTVAGDESNWQVYASHREWLDRVSLQLESGAARGNSHASNGVGAQRFDCGDPARFTPEGFIRGQLLAAMIASWLARSEEFAPEDPQRFREGMEMLRSFLEGVEWIRWCASTPEPDAVESLIRLDLAPAVSSP